MNDFLVKTDISEVFGYDNNNCFGRAQTKIGFKTKYWFSVRKKLMLIKRQSLMVLTRIIRRKPHRNLRKINKQTLSRRRMTQ